MISVFLTRLASFKDFQYRLRENTIYVALLDRNQYSMWEIELELAARCDRSPSTDSQTILSRSDSFREIAFERLQVSISAHFHEEMSLDELSATISPKVLAT